MKQHSMTLFRSEVGGFVHRGKGTRVTIHDFFFFETAMHQWGIDCTGVTGGNLIHHTSRPDRKTNMWGIMLGHQQGGESKGYEGPVWVLGADVDRGTLPPLGELPSLLGHRFFAHTSFHGAYHLFLELSQPVGPAVVPAILGWLSERLGDCVETSAKNVNRVWTLPVGDYQWVSGDGPPLDPGRFGIAVQQPREKRTCTVPPRAEIQHDALGWIEQDLRDIAACPAGAGKRNSTLNRLAFGIGTLVAGLGRDAAEFEPRLGEAVTAQAEQYGDAERAAELLDSVAVVERAFREGLRNPRDLAAYETERDVQELLWNMRRLRRAA